MSKKGWHWDDGRNWLAANWSEVRGGWSEVLALRGRGGKQKSDQRILGEREFVQDVPIFGTNLPLADALHLFFPHSLRVGGSIPTAEHNSSRPLSSVICLQSSVLFWPTK